ncbi:MAG: hypothetical protein H6672_16945 [Anaerolineaceae bacterium]|nr:hypothetical protein [Anaerolineaceae bacterium]
MTEGLPELANWIRNDKSRLIIRFIAIFGIVYPFVSLFNIQNTLIPEWLAELLSLSIIPGLYFFLLVFITSVAGVIGVLIGLRDENNPRLNSFTRSIENVIILFTTSIILLTSIIFTFILGVLGLVIFLIIDLRIERKIRQEINE